MYGSSESKLRLPRKKADLGLWPSGFSRWDPIEGSYRNWLQSISACSEGFESIRDRLTRMGVSKLERPVPRTRIGACVGAGRS